MIVVAAGLLISAVFVSGLRKGWAMGAFDRLVLFSEVRGTVLKHGAPVAGAELIQKVVWSDNENEIAPQRAVTDEKGAFRFQPITRAAWFLRLIPAQPIMLQKIVIRYEGVEYTAWRHSKNSYDADTELDGRPIRLVCELTSQPDYDGKHYGICRAEVD
ncbi:DUF4198 domain-containing protein [Trinickia dinghuensis]|nr:DUF4198 domain-containing protein [Trinickia dinghuensis]